MVIKSKNEAVKTVLTISMGFLVIYLATKWQWAIIVSLLVGVVGVFSGFLSKKIDIVWMKLAWLLGLVIPNIILTLIFYLFLLPISLISRIFRKSDPMILKNRVESTYVDTNRQFDKISFEKPW